MTWLKKDFWFYGADDREDATGDADRRGGSEVRKER